FHGFSLAMKTRSAVGRAMFALRQIPYLSRGAIAIPNLKPSTVGGTAAGDIQAATRLRVYEAILVSPAPLLSLGAVTGTELHLGPAGGTASGNVHALGADAERSVSAVPRPVLSVRAVAHRDPNRGAVVGTRSGIDALAAVSADRPSIPILGP